MTDQRAPDAGEIWQQEARGPPKSARAAAQGARRAGPGMRRRRGRSWLAVAGYAALGLVCRAIQGLQSGSVAQVEVAAIRCGSNEEWSAMSLARQSGLVCALTGGAGALNNDERADGRLFRELIVPATLVAGPG